MIKIKNPHYVDPIDTFLDMAALKVDEALKTTYLNIPEFTMEQVTNFLHNQLSSDAELKSAWDIVSDKLSDNGSMYDGTIDSLKQRIEK